MPQEIRVVRCFRCEVYQVDIVKKAKKWQCKLCGEKQSVLMEFGRGTGEECRLLVQKLNNKRKDTDVAISNLSSSFMNENKSLYIDDTDDKNRIDIHLNEMGSERENKWSKFVESNHDNNKQHEEDSSEFKTSTYEEPRSFSSARRSLKRSTEEYTDIRPSKISKCDYKESKQNFDFNHEENNVGNLSQFLDQKSAQNSIVSKKIQRNSKWSTFFDGQKSDED